MNKTVAIEGKNSLFIAGQAYLYNDDTTIDRAWAERYIEPNPAIKWVLGKFVEADNANNNKQFWSLADLEMGQPTIQHAPMNMLHRPRNIVGAYVATDLLFPIDTATEQVMNPYIEALAAFWAYYFPQELAMIEDADANGSLFFSMECVAKNMICEGEHGCKESFAYVGADSDTYCEHLRAHASIRHLSEPHFLGGALIIPPVRPGWSNAVVKSLSQFVQEHQEEAEAAYEMAREATPHLTPKEWEGFMGEIMLNALSEKFN